MTRARSLPFGPVVSGYTATGGTDHGLRWQINAPVETFARVDVAENCRALYLVGADRDLIVAADHGVGRRHYGLPGERTIVELDEWNDRDLIAVARAHLGTGEHLRRRAGEIHRGRK